MIMIKRIANYTAFYVSEPFSQSNLGAAATPDFIYYNQLCAWKGKDCSFPFIDAHKSTYNVRDDSSWETLKSRLHERLRGSKNIVLFLSENTKNSRALREEIDYGINTLGLPIIVIYPDFKDKEYIANNTGIRFNIKKLWKKLPVFNNNMRKVPTLHVPYNKNLIRAALLESDFMAPSMITNAGEYFF